MTGRREKDSGICFRRAVRGSARVLALTGDQEVHHEDSMGAKGGRGNQLVVPLRRGTGALPVVGIGGIYGRCLRRRYKKTGRCCGLRP